MFSSEDAWQCKCWQASVHYWNMPISTFFWFFVIPHLRISTPAEGAKAKGCHWLLLLTLEHWDFSHCLSFYHLLAFLLYQQGGFGIIVIIWWHYLQKILSWKNVWYIACTINVTGHYYYQSLLNVHIRWWLAFLKQFPSHGPWPTNNLSKPVLRVQRCGDTETSMTSWKPYRFLKQYQVSEWKVFCPHILKPTEELSLGSQESWLKDLSCSQMSLFKGAKWTIKFH